MGFAGRALPILRIASLTVAVSLVGATGVGYWFFVSQQRDYIIGRDFRVLTNLTRQIDNAARAEARVMQVSRSDRTETASGPCRTSAYEALRGKPFEPTDITFAVNTPPKDRAVPAHAFRVNSHLMLDVPLENAGRQKPTASLNLQPGLEKLFQLTVGPGAFDAILARHTRRAGARQCGVRGGAASFQRIGRAVVEGARSQSTRLKFKELSEAITMADVTAAGSITRYSSLRAACR